jgi:hypothetical protein
MYGSLYWQELAQAIVIFKLVQTDGLVGPFHLTVLGQSSRLAPFRLATASSSLEA